MIGDIGYINFRQQAVDSQFAQPVMRADDDIGTFASRRRRFELIADIAETQFVHNHHDAEFFFELCAQLFQDRRACIVRPDRQAVVLSRDDKYARQHQHEQNKKSCVFHHGFLH